MPAANVFHVREVRLPEDFSALRVIRQSVFVEEQGIPASLEWDGLDESSRHVLAFNHRREAVGTGRLSPDGRIGWIAVLARNRYQPCPAGYPAPAGGAGRSPVCLPACASQRGRFVSPCRLHAMRTAFHRGGHRTCEDGKNAGFRQYLEWKEPWANP